MACQYATNCPAPPAHPPAGTLPFTGLDLAGILFLAVLIILAGLLIRVGIQAERRPDQRPRGGRIHPGGDQ